MRPRQGIRSSMGQTFQPFPSVALRFVALRCDERAPAVLRRNIFVQATAPLAIHRFGCPDFPARLAAQRKRCCPHGGQQHRSSGPELMPTKSSLRNKGAPVAPDIHDLDQMGREALLDLWPLVMGSIVPRQISQGLMRRFLAFELQAKAGGGLSKSDMGEIAHLGEGRSPAKATRLALGSRFLREWNRTTHIVERIAAGYLWNGGRPYLVVVHRQGHHRRPLVRAALFRCKTRGGCRSAPETGCQVNVPSRTQTRPQPLRCAIYTRKSSEEGLEQGFNSLDAQYEACAAYVASQRHEG